ncbi:hypothetical protein GIB67_042056 [Kingdonia uniflora]|uniref:BHLH domain-containing protein n=1 Tax=Kingdonia uniflora TaxID=39325 RepID=A0A7J7MVN8_9MAGN|nr:hypothetical protein GIB67_042056 [Kingdonia uniflora]
MCSLMKESLKCICGENQWDYAVFWRTGYQNPRLLVWEDYHYEPHTDSTFSVITGIDSTKSLFEEWKGLWNSATPQRWYQAEDKVHSLLNRMMANNQVHVVGEGVVGRAAFTGCHQWILQENTIRQGNLSDVMEEVHHQFSAGIQTIAVIPVLSHGVVQLGSTHAVVENMRFVSDVKILIAQLGGVPDSILLNNSVENPCQTIKVSTSLGVPLIADLEKLPNSQAARFTSFARCNQELSTAQASELFNQSYYSLTTKTGENMQPNGLAMQRTSNALPTPTQSLSDLFQEKPLPVVKPMVEAGAAGAQVIFSKSDRQLNLQPSMHSSSSIFNHKHLQLGSFCHNLNPVEHKIDCGAWMQELGLNRLPASNKPATSQLNSTLGGFPNSLKSSDITSFLGGSKSLNSVKDHQTSFSCSIPYKSARSKSSLEGFPLSSYDKSLADASDHGNPLNNGDALHMVPHGGYFSDNDNHFQNKWTAGKQVVDHGTCQTVNIPQAHQNKHTSSCYSPMGDRLQDGWARSLSVSSRRPSSQNVSSEDPPSQPPLGNELFDIFLLDYRRKQVSGSSIDQLIDGEDILKISSSDVSCTRQIDTAGPENIAVNDGISESGVFLETGSDHLLDAVVSKVQTCAKWNADENLSCWTTLTKTSSSVLTDSPTCTQDIAPYQRQEKLFSKLSSFVKPQIIESSSIRSGCSKENAGVCSQLNSMYESRISLDEDSSDTKCDNSISTAHSKRPESMEKSNRKRLRPGESLRPRPKDRQNIQDRVKELREIVPNGAKCSIDALLERTIKHMFFLQSVTKHGDKLKQTVESKACALGHKVRRHQAQVLVGHAGLPVALKCIDGEIVYRGSVWCAKGRGPG